MIPLVVVVPNDKVGLGDKGSFVLKTLIDTRGRGVHIGRELDAASWQQLVQQACAGRLVVQEYIPPLIEWLEVDTGQRECMSTVLALYLYGGQATGIFGRASAAAVSRHDRAFGSNGLPPRARSICADAHQHAQVFIPRDER